MYGSYGRFLLDQSRNDYEKIQRRRLWTERFNQAYVDLTGNPFVDDNPARTTELFDNAIPAEEAAKRVAQEGKVYKQD